LCCPAPAYTAEDVQKCCEQKKPLPPLRWSRWALAEFAGALVLIMETQMGIALIHAMTMFLQDLNCLEWGSACSGAETPLFCILALLPHLRRYCPTLQQSHLFAAEMVEEKPSGFPE